MVQDSIKLHSNRRFLIAPRCLQIFLQTFDSPKLSPKYRSLPFFYLHAVRCLQWKHKLAFHSLQMSLFIEPILIELIWIELSWIDLSWTESLMCSIEDLDTWSGVLMVAAMAILLLPILAVPLVFGGTRAKKLKAKIYPELLKVCSCTAIKSILLGLVSRM